MANSTPAKPLDGFRVLDFTQNIAGPLAGQVLADLGAEVIKVEAPGGEAARQITAVLPGRPPLPTLFLPNNRGKKSVAVDLTTDEAKQQILRLVDTADVVLEGFRPGVMERMGLGPDDLRVAQPQTDLRAAVGLRRQRPARQQAGRRSDGRGRVGHDHRHADADRQTADHSVPAGRRRQRPRAGPGGAGRAAQPGAPWGGRRGAGRHVRRRGRAAGQPAHDPSEQAERGAQAETGLGAKSQEAQGSRLRHPTIGRVQGGRRVPGDQRLCAQALGEAVPDHRPAGPAGGRAIHRPAFARNELPRIDRGTRVGAGRQDRGRMG